MFRLAVVKISKLNVVILVIASDIIIAIYMRELAGCFYFKWDLVLKYLTGLYTV